MINWKASRWSLGALLLIVVLDLFFSFLSYAAFHGYSFSAFALSWSNVSSFEDDAVDIILCSIARVSLLSLLFGLAIVYAAPDYVRALEEKQREARQHNRRAARRREQRKEADDAAAEQRISINGNGSYSNGSSSKSAPLLPAPAAAASSASSSASFLFASTLFHAPLVSTPSADDIVPVPRELAQADKHVINTRCSRYRTAVFVCVFVLCTLMQVLVGIKIVSFHFQRGHEFPVALFFALPILFINLEQHCASRLIARLTREEGYLFRSLHPHKLYYDVTAYGHGCDVCRKRIKESYRCNVCDFDLCHVCFARKNRVRGEGVVRGDKGVKEETEITSTQYLLRALKLARPHCGLIMLALLCLVVNAAAQLFAPNLQGQILDDVIRGVNGEPGAGLEFTRDIQFYIAVSVVTGLFGSIRSLCFSLVGSKISRDVRDQLYSSILKQDIAFFDSVTSGELTSRLARDTEAMVSPMQSVLATSLSNALLLVGGLVMVFVTSWKLSILAITSIFPIIQITRIYAKYSRKVNKQTWAALAESSNLATQAITNIRTVRAFGTEHFEDAVYREATNEALEKSMLDAKASSLSYTLTSYLDLGTTVLLLWYGGLVVMETDINYDDPLTVGKLITFQLYWNLMNSAYSQLNSLLNQFTKAAAAAQKVMMLSDTMPDLVTKRTSRTAASKELHGEIDVQGLAFSYQMRPEHQVLHDINLHIPAGTTCAFVGRSGGGKSTLVHLLLRFYDAKAGSIRYDGVPIDEWDLSVLRRQIASVAQDSQLFATSVIENITYGMRADEYSREDVIKAAKAANGQPAIVKPNTAGAHARIHLPQPLTSLGLLPLPPCSAYDFIMEMDEGFDTRVGERGQRISGGQRQRLAICRAFMRKPKVLLLDEATSALDAESESQVQAAIDNLMSLTRCTVLLVAHRLSTVMNADQICVLDGGTIIERGSHEQLLQQEGLYYELVKRQLQRKANLLDDGEDEAGGGEEAEQAAAAAGKPVDSIDVLIAQTAKKRNKAAAVVKGAEEEQKE